tara:strand:- start:6881 stop:7303 length:423 start_codon:yes stop_codon:yes gene_type:complete
MLPVVSQNISKGEIKTLVSDNNDTLVIMHIEDAKKFLTDLLKYEITDSLLTIFVIRDSISEEKIILKDNVINTLKKQLGNFEDIIKNLEGVINNKEDVLKLKNKTIKGLKKEIRKHKREKTIAIITAIVLPILTTLLILI